jgi:hypothetical protein
VALAQNDRNFSWLASPDAENRLRFLALFKAICNIKVIDGFGQNSSQSCKFMVLLRALFSYFGAEV